METERLLHLMKTGFEDVLCRHGFTIDLLLPYFLRGWWWGDTEVRLAHCSGVTALKTPWPLESITEATEDCLYQPFVYQDYKMGTGLRYKLQANGFLWAV